ncbi:MAG: AraC family transcriptional regulator [Eubacteriales bacterium]|jgi:AraC-like DNA-binding protein
MKSRMLLNDENKQILPEYEHRDFPLSMHEQPVGKQGYANVPHWHSEVQFAFVTHGDVLFRTQKGEYHLREGEAIFFNCNCVHEAVSRGEQDDSVYLCIKFNPSLIYGQSGSRIRARYIDPIIYSTRLTAMPLRQEDWQREICRRLQRMAELYESGENGFELKINVLLMEVWLHLYEHIHPLVEETVSISYSDKQRSEILHQYIHQNYTEKITLDDIAGAAHVSRGECCRIFKRLHHTTPFQYLIRFRLSQSIRLLSETDLSISQIAQQVGFGSSSYYTECFKRELHCTPHKYRQRLNHITFGEEQKKYPFDWEGGNWNTSCAMG